MLIFFGIHHILWTYSNFKALSFKILSEIVPLARVFYHYMPRQKQNKFYLTRSFRYALITCFFEFLFFFHKLSKRYKSTISKSCFSGMQFRHIFAAILKKFANHFIYFKLIISKIIQLWN